MTPKERWKYDRHVYRLTYAVYAMRQRVLRLEGNAELLSTIPAVVFLMHYDDFYWKLLTKERWAVKIWEKAIEITHRNFRKYYRMRMGATE